MPNDQFRRTRVGRGKSVVRRSRKGQQDRALTESLVDWRDSRGGYHQTRRRAAEQSADFAKAASTRHKYALANASLEGRTARGGDSTYRLVARNQRIAHAWKTRHPAKPEQTLRATADAAPLDIDDHVVLGR